MERTVKTATAHHSMLGFRAWDSVCSEGTEELSVSLCHRVEVSLQQIPAFKTKNRGVVTVSCFWQLSGEEALPIGLLQDGSRSLN